VFELLVIAIGVLAVAGVVAVLRSRRSEGDPAGSVQAFNRALSAMEPGAQGARPTVGDADDVRDEASEEESGRSA
jgi:hypothetical protein